MSAKMSAKKRKGLIFFGGVNLSLQEFALVTPKNERRTKGKLDQTNENQNYSIDFVMSV